MWRLLKERAKCERCGKRVIFDTWRWRRHKSLRWHYFCADCTKAREIESNRR
jgi:DNA-directed RNA polymerase subunit RPC12/RpoP